MPRGNPYTPEQRKSAVDLYVAKGLKQAAEETGINKRTIQGWASKAGRSAELSENRKAATEAAAAEFERRRENLKLRLINELEAALDDMRQPFTKTVVDQKGYEHEITNEPEPSDRAKLATAAGILFDKLQLATGSSTSNTQNVNIDIKAPNLKALISNKEQQNEAMRNAITVESRQLGEAS
jgi:transposase